MLLNIDASVFECGLSRNRRKREHSEHNTISVQQKRIILY